MGGGGEHKIFSEKIAGPWNIQVYGLLGYEKFFENFIKPSGPPPTDLMYTPLAENTFQANLANYYQKTPCKQFSQNIIRHFTLNNPCKTIIR